MSKKTDKDEKKSQVEEVNPDVVEDDEADSPWYYFYSQGCGWCKKSEPIVYEINSDGKLGEILKLDLADSDNRALNDELKKEYNIQCGTPWFINEATGKSICGFREKDVIEKWLKGEDIPAPPRPKSPLPKLPLLEAPKSEVDKWKKEYKKWLAGEDIPVPPRPKGPIPKTPLLEAPEKEVNEWKVKYEKWLKENDHLPDNQKRTADQLLSQPRPKTEPPSPPNPSMTDTQIDSWGEEYDKWRKENSHLPNLQPASTIVERLKSQRNNNNPVGANNVPAPVDNGKINSVDARVQALEVKVDKIINHFGIK